MNAHETIPSPGWRTVLDKLDVWLRDPSALADEDVDPPAATTIRLASAIARHCAATLPPPIRLMPNREAGIIFEWVVGETLRMWEVDDEHRCEITHYVEGHRLNRRVVPASELLLSPARFD